LIEYVDERGRPEFEQPGRAAPAEVPLEPAEPEVDRRAWAEALRQRTEPTTVDAPLAGPNGRSRKYDLRCSEEEVTRWEAAAQAEGISTSQFLRAAADARAAVVVG